MSQRQKGSIIIYILIAIFLTGVLIAGMTQGAKKSASSEQLNEMMLYLQSDLRTVQANITECVQTYSAAVDINNDGLICSKLADPGCASASIDNPNAPFPLYCADTTTCAVSGMTSGAAGTALTSAGCPGAPNVQDIIFNAKITQSLKLLQDTANYTVSYFNTATEGIFIRITRAVSDPLWLEAISRISQPVTATNAKFSPCSVAAVTVNPDPLGFNCAGGCLYFWILRQPTSSTAFKTGCP